MRHEVGDVGDGRRTRREPRYEVGIDDLSHPVRSLGTAAAKIVVGSRGPGPRDRCDIWLDLRSLGRGDRLRPLTRHTGTAEPVRIGRRLSGTKCSDRLGKPGSGISLGAKGLLASSVCAHLRGKARPPQILMVADRSGERSTHQRDPVFAKLSAVNCRRKRSSSSWRARTSSSAATRASARASSTVTALASTPSDVGAAVLTVPRIGS